MIYYCRVERSGVECTLHRAPVGQGPSGPDWLAIALGFWSGRALATGTAWAGLCLIHHHHQRSGVEWSGVEWSGVEWSGVKCLVHRTVLPR